MEREKIWIKMMQQRYGKDELVRMQVPVPKKNLRGKKKYAQLEIQYSRRRNGSKAIMKTKKEIREKIIEIATKMDAAKTINEVASWHILNDKKALLEWVLD